MKQYIIDKMSTSPHSTVSNITRLQILGGERCVLLHHPPERPRHVSQDIAGAHSWSRWGSEPQVSLGTRLHEPGKGSQLRRTKMVVWYIGTDSWTTDHCRTTRDQLAGQCVFSRECNRRPLTHRASSGGARLPSRESVGWSPLSRWMGGLQRRL